MTSWALTLNLPIDVWRNGITDFISLKDLVRLESALSNHKLRQQYFANIAGSQLKTFNLNQPSAVELVRWCCVRNVLPVHVYYPRGGDESSPTIWSLTTELKFFCKNIKSAALFEINGSEFSVLIDACQNTLTKVVFSTVTVLPNMAKCTSLVNCHISFSHDLSDSSLIDSLGECRGLRRLVIYCCPNITGKGICQLARALPKLEELNINIDVPIEFTCLLAALGVASNMQKLNVSKATITGADLLNIDYYAPRLKSLQVIATNDTVRDDHVEGLVRALLQLEHLRLENFRHLTAESLIAVAHNRALVRTLSLISCPALTDEGVLAVARGCRLLQTVNVSYCVLLTDAAVQALCSNCTELTSLNVAGCVLLTDAAFDVPVPALTTLIVSGTNLTGSFALTVLQYSTALTSLWCNECPQLGTVFVTALVEVPHRIQDLHLSKSNLSYSDLLRLSVSEHLSNIFWLDISYSGVADRVIIRNLLDRCRCRDITASGCPNLTKELVSERLNS